MKGVIIFGPWVGEFSYELSWWNPECRKIRQEQYPNYHAVHLGFNGRKVAYDDFIDEYIPHPKELEDTLQYPATYGEHINGQDIIPLNFIKHLNNVIKELKERGYNTISIHKPKDIPITRDRCMQDYPYGNYVHYTIRPEIEGAIKKQVEDHFNNDNPTIFLMARMRTRKGKTCYLDWNPQNWILFTRAIIEDLGINVITLNIQTQGSRGGSIGLENHPELQDLKSNLMDFTINNDEDSLEKQYAILKNTSCSIYGASGAAVVPFFVHTPTFTQQTKEEGFRLTLGWERDLTNNLENVVIFDKYRNNEIYNSSVTELVDEFSKFYKQL
jgi:hypothetical protein